MLEYSEIDPYIHKCVRCGTCKAVVGLYQPSCPAGERFRFEGFFSSGKIWIARGLKEGVLAWNDADLLKKLFACTLCGNCTQQCPMTVKERIIEVFEAMRTEAVRRGTGPLAPHKSLADNIRNYLNPWGQPRRRRLQWTKGRTVKQLARGTNEKASVLYFVGCTAALDPTLHHIVQHTAGILEMAAVDFGILGEDELCCGSVLMRVGQRDAALELAHQTIETINATGATTVVTSCAGCYKTLSQDYPYHGRLNARVIHSSQLILELVAKGKLRRGKKSSLAVTYHDPCHLGRQGKVFDAPREVIRSFGGVRLREMARNRENAWCCGAGGGVRSAFPEMALETSRLRIREASATGATTLVTACPFCLQNLRAAIHAEGSSIPAVDLTDFVVSMIS